MTSTASALGKKKRFIIVKRKAVEYEEADTTSSEGADTTSSEEADTTSSEGADTTSSEGASRLSEYIAQLTEQEIIVMKIASEHLKTSFDLEKSSGYLQYLRK
jgi:hypothetical protein